MIQIHPVKLESYLFSEKQCWPAGGGFSKTISLCIPQMCPWFHSKVRGYQRRNKGGTKINRYFYFVHILSIPGYATFIIIHKSSRWAVFFGKSLFSGQFSREKNRFFFQGIQLFSCKNKSIILPVGLRFPETILNTSPSQRKHISEHLFSQNSSQWLLSTEAAN